MPKGQAGAAAAHVIHQVGDAAHVFDAVAHQRLALLAVIDVTGQRQGAPTKATDFVGDSLNSASERAVHTTSARPANARAIARPMPRPLPVTMAIPLHLETLQNTHDHCSTGSTAPIAPAVAPISSIVLSDYAPAMDDEQCPLNPMIHHTLRRSGDRVEN